MYECRVKVNTQEAVIELLKMFELLCCVGYERTL